jgi:hypothetical protein
MRLVSGAHSLVAGRASREEEVGKFRQKTALHNALLESLQAAVAAHCTARAFAWLTGRNRSTSCRRSSGFATHMPRRL